MPWSRLAAVTNPRVPIAAHIQIEDRNFTCGLTGNRVHRYSAPDGKITIRNREGLETVFAAVMRFCASPPVPKNSSHYGLRKTCIIRMTYMPPRVSIIIPCYNESAIIGETLRAGDVVISGSVVVPLATYRLWRYVLSPRAAAATIRP